MIAKCFEVRDSGTLLPVLAVKCDPANEAERYLLGRTGYGIIPETQKGYVLLCSLNADNAELCYDPHQWGNRTRVVAHEFIKANFGTLETGSVVDVQYILGETQAPKVSEAVK